MRRLRTGLLAASVLAALLVGLAGCGGSGSSGFDAVASEAHAIQHVIDAGDCTQFEQSDVLRVGRGGPGSVRRRAREDPDRPTSRSSATGVPIVREVHRAARVHDRRLQRADAASSRPSARPKTVRGARRRRRSRARRRWPAHGIDRGARRTDDRPSRPRSSPRCWSTTARRPRICRSRAHSSPTSASISSTSASGWRSSSRAEPRGHSSSPRAAARRSAADPARLDAPALGGARRSGRRTSRRRSCCRRRRRRGGRCSRCRSRVSPARSTTCCCTNGRNTEPAVSISRKPARSAARPTIGGRVPGSISPSSAKSAASASSSFCQT